MDMDFVEPACRSCRKPKSRIDGDFYTVSFHANEFATPDSLAHNFCSFGCLATWVMEELKEREGEDMYTNSDEEIVEVLKNWVED